MCVLYAQLMKHQTAVNQNGLAYIEARVDEDAVRGCPVCGGLRHLEEHDAQGYRRVRPCAGTNALRRIELFNAARVLRYIAETVFAAPYSEPYEWAGEVYR